VKATAAQRSGQHTALGVHAERREDRGPAWERLDFAAHAAVGAHSLLSPAATSK